MRRIVFAVLALGYIGTADAGCSWRWVNGQQVPLCDNTFDIPPPRPPEIAPIAPPSIRPIEPLIVPPVGTSRCRTEQVCTGYGQCSWESVCY